MKHYEEKNQENNFDLNFLPLLDTVLTQDTVKDPFTKTERVEAEISHIDTHPSYDYEINAVMIYMNEIGRYRLLTLEEEVLLFRKISQGDREAKEVVVNGNYRLVVKLANRYCSRGMEYLDLIQAGNEGLLKAVDKFDYRKGYKFSTYATWWIRQSITRYIAEHSRLIRIPVHMMETLRKLQQALSLHTTNLQRKATSIELAAALSVTKERIDYLFGLMEDAVGEEVGPTAGDMIMQNDEKQPFDVVADILLKEQLNEVLDILTPREKEVLQLRYGFRDGCTRSLADVGCQFGVTRERIRQIEGNALRKLRHPSISIKLNGYLSWK